MAGVLGIVTGFLILSFYAVIGGWTIAYAVQHRDRRTAAGASPQAVQAQYDALLASPLRMLAYHALFMATTGAIVARGVARRHRGGVQSADAAAHGVDGAARGLFGRRRRRCGGAALSAAPRPAA